MNTDLKLLTLQSQEIEQILPHAPPFLFIQEATIEQNSITGRYTISGEEYFLKGHFKEEPIFPASIMFEALGQLGVLFLLKCEHPSLTKKIDNKRMMFVACNRTACHTVMRPKDTLNMQLQLDRIRHPLVKFNGLVTNQHGKKVLSMEGLTLAFNYCE